MQQLLASFKGPLAPILTRARSSSVENLPAAVARAARSGSVGSAGIHILSRGSPTRGGAVQIPHVAVLLSDGKAKGARICGSDREQEIVKLSVIASDDGIVQVPALVSTSGAMSVDDKSHAFRNHAQMRDVLRGNVAIYNVGYLGADGEAEVTRLVDAWAARHPRYSLASDSNCQGMVKFLLIELEKKGFVKARDKTAWDTFKNTPILDCDFVHGVVGLSGGAFHKLIVQTRLESTYGGKTSSAIGSQLPGALSAGESQLAARKAAAMDPQKELQAAVDELASALARASQDRAPAPRG